MKKSRKFLSLLLTLLMVLGIASPAVYAAPSGVKVDSSKIVILTDTSHDSHPASNMFDGLKDSDHRWCCAFGSVNPFVVFKLPEKVIIETMVSTIHTDSEANRQYSLMHLKNESAYNALTEETEKKAFLDNINNWKIIVEVNNFNPQKAVVETKIDTTIKTDIYRLNVTEGQADSNEWANVSELELYSKREAFVNPKTITFQGNGAEGSMKAVTVEMGDKFTLPQNGFTVPNGKEFIGWSVNNGAAQQPDAVIVVNDNVVIKALWKDIVTHAVTFNGNGGDGNMPPQNIKEGTEYTLPQCTFTPPNGKIFSHWDIGGTTYNPNDKIKVNANVEIKAIWVTNEKGITLYFEPGEGTGEIVSQYLPDKSVYTPLPDCSFTPPAGKIFKCWKNAVSDFVSKPGKTLGYGNIPETEFRWIAQYEDLYYDNANIAIQSGEVVPHTEFNVIYNGFNGNYNNVLDGIIASDNYYYSSNRINRDYGDYIIFEAKTSFAASAFQIFSSEKDTVPGKYTLSVMKNEGGYMNTPEADKQSYLLDSYNWEELAVEENINYDKEKVTYIENPRKAKYYKFTMYDDGRGHQYNAQLTELLLFVGHDNVNASTISFNAENGFGEKRDIVVEKGSIFKLGNCQFAPKDGYEFNSWVVNGQNYNIGDTITISGDTVVTAKFTEINYSTVSFTLEGGTVEPIKIKTGTNVSLPLCPNVPTGKVFAGWSIGGKTYSAGEMYKVSGNVSATATYISLNIKAPSASDTAWSDGIYEATGTLEIPNRVTVSGTVLLKLAEGAVLNIPKGICVPEGATLIIEGSGTLNVKAQGGAAIGGNENSATGKIIINGGTINANANEGKNLNHACIGGGSDGTNSATVIINNGVITANSKDGAAIGGGGGANSSCNVTINGGKIIVTATESGSCIGGGRKNLGAKVTINGGDITATGKDGSGIGGGAYGSVDIVINGGNISAKTTYDGVGIGSGYTGKESTITINGGKIKVAGYVNSPGIGSGYSGEKVILNITGGIIEPLNSSSQANMIGSGYTAKPLEALYPSSSGGVIITNCFTVGNIERHKMNIIYSLDEGKKINIYGTPVIKEDFSIPQNGVIYINKGETLVIPKGVTVTGPGKIINNGTVVCTGLLTATIEGNQPVEGKDMATISFDSNGGTGTMDAVRKEKGQTFVLPKPSFTPPTDMRLDYWEIDGVKYNVEDTVTLNKNVIAVAHWKNIKYVNVKFLEGSGTAPYRPEIYKHDSEDVFEIPYCLFKAPQNCVFEGWKIAGDDRLYKKGEKLELTADIVLTAQWVELSNKAFDGLVLENGIYTVDTNKTVAEPIEIVGDVILHLNKDTTLTAQKGIIVPFGSSLTIEGEGSVVATPMMVDKALNLFNAAIGGRAKEKSGTVIINGGNINLPRIPRKVQSGAGIGSGAEGINELVIINGGNICTDSFEGAGIGTGINSTWVNSLGTILITGGKILAKSGSGSAIGIGEITKQNYTNPTGKVIISGGNVTAKSVNQINSIGTEYGSGVKFSTGKNGNAYILMKHKSKNFDESDKANWSGIISFNDGYDYEIYGNPVIKEDIIFPEQAVKIRLIGASLVINKGVTFKTSATVFIYDKSKIVNNGTFDIGDCGADVIDNTTGSGECIISANSFSGYSMSIVPLKDVDNLSYTGEVLADSSDFKLVMKPYGITWTLKNIKTEIIMVDTNESVDNIKNAGDYRIKYNNKSYTSRYSVTVKKASVTPTLKNNKIKVGDGAFVPESEIALPDTNGVFTYFYEGVDGTNYPKSETVPTLQGKYKVYITYNGDNCEGTNEDTLYIQGKATYIQPKKLTALPGQKLSDIIIPSGKNKGTFTWNNPQETVKNGLNTYLATYTDNNSDLYYPDTTVKIQVEVKEFVMVSFSAGEGEGSMNPIIVEKGSYLNLPECGFIAPKLQKFSKWNLGEAGQKVKVSGNIIIEAQYSDGCEVLGNGVCSADSNVKWVLTTDGRLNIYGVGRMLDYTKAGAVAPWSRYNDRVHSVNIGDGVTYVGEKAFVDSINLQYIRISDTVKEINLNAFADLTGVTVLAKQGFVNENLVNATIRQNGDINGDAGVTAEDYSLAVNEALGSRTLEADKFEAADTNNDGIIDVLDLMVIKNLSVEIDELPII